MAIQRLSLTVCLLSAITLLGGSTASGKWDWRVSPIPVVAGHNITVTVEDAPESPVKVEIWIGGKLVHTEDLSELPGSTSYPVPSGAAGDTWEVRVSTTSSSQSDGGTII